MLGLIPTLRRNVVWIFPHRVAKKKFPIYNATFLLSTVSVNLALIS